MKESDRLTAINEPSLTPNNQREEIKENEPSLKLVKDKTLDEIRNERLGACKEQMFTDKFIPTHVQEESYIAPNIGLRYQANL